MNELTDEEKELLDAVVQRHAPLIGDAIKHLRNTNKIGHQFDDDDLYHTGYNAIVEALTNYDPSKGSFKYRAKDLIKKRMLGQIEKEMARSGNGGVDPYFRAQARNAKLAREAKLSQEQPTPQTPVQPATSISTTPTPTDTAVPDQVESTSNIKKPTI